MKPCILLIEDDQDMRDLVSGHLEHSGFDVQRADDGIKGQALALQYTPDLILLDLMLPKVDGLTLCQRLRRDDRTAQIPILMLTALAGTKDKVTGFNSGADDYLTKPFDNRELIARSKAILSRTMEKKEVMAGRLKADGIILDPETHEVFIEDELVILTHTEFRLLHLMMERVGRVQSRENLLVNVWNYDTDIETRTVDNHVGRLRGKMGSKGEMIKTVRGVGYKLAID